MIDDGETIDRAAGAEKAVSPPDTEAAAGTSLVEPGAATEASRMMLNTPSVAAALANFVDYRQRLMDRVAAAVSPRTQIAQYAAKMRERDEQLRKVLQGPDLQPFLDFHARAQEVAGRIRSSYLDTINATAERYERFRERLEELDAKERDLMSHLAPLGWVLSPQMAMSAMEQLHDGIATHGVAAIDELLMGYFNDEVVTGIVDGLCEVPSAEPWVPRLREALDAHLRQQYGLSIPIWLMAIDGLSSRLETTDLFSRIGTAKHGPKIEAALLGPRAHRSPQFEALLQNLVAAGKAGKKLPDSGPALRRHIILHGQDPDYASLRTSVQGLLLLEGLYWFVETKQAEKPVANEGAATDK